MAGRENGYMLKLSLHLPCHNICLANAVYLITKEFNANTIIAGVCWDNLKCITTHSKSTAVKIHIVTLILNVNQLMDNIIPVLHIPWAQANHHVLEIVWLTNAVNAGN